MTSDSKKTTLFGKHVMLEMYNCAPETLNDREIVLNILKNLPGEIGMRILVDPVVVFAEPNGKKDSGGWSGFVMIHESHISVHTFIKRGFVTIDVYSCNDFDSAYVLDYFKKIFKTEDVEFEVVPRGKKFPHQDIIE